MGWIGGIYAAGLFISLGVLRARSGVPFWFVGIPRPVPLGLLWGLVNGAKAFAWPLTLVIWLATGQPEPRIVFGHKAEQRARAEQLGQQRMTTL